MNKTQNSSSKLIKISNKTIYSHNIGVSLFLIVILATAAWLWGSLILV